MILSNSRSTSIIQAERGGALIGSTIRATKRYKGPQVAPRAAFGYGCDIREPPLDYMPTVTCNKILARSVISAKTIMANTEID